MNPLDTFFEKLLASRKRFKWEIRSERIRCLYNACPLTAVAWSEPRGSAEFAAAADILGLSIIDRCLIIDAADQQLPRPRVAAMRHRLLEALDLKESR